MRGSPPWLVVLGVCVAAGFLITGQRREVLLFIVTMAGATALNLILKASFARDRPAASFDTPLPSSYRFPSGHALLSLCFYGAVAASISPGLKRRPIAASATPPELRPATRKRPGRQWCGPWKAWSTRPKKSWFSGGWRTKSGQTGRKRGLDGKERRWLIDAEKGHKNGRRVRI